MKTVGDILKEARAKKKLSRDKLEKETKIKREFIDAIEKGDWERLPDFPVVQGFVKSIAQRLKVDEKKAAALLRRDYPPKDLRVNPKPDVSDKFTWSPKFTFLVGVAIVTIIILGYLGYQYKQFISPPPLNVTSPKDGQVVEDDNLLVAGSTSSDAKLEVNNQPVLLEDDGTFSVEIEIAEDTNEIKVKAISRSGKETVIHRKIEPRFNEN